MPFVPEYIPSSPDYELMPRYERAGIEIDVRKAWAAAAAEAASGGTLLTPNQIIDVILTTVEPLIDRSRLVQEQKTASNTEHPLKWAFLSSDEAHAATEQARLLKSSREAEDYSEDRRRRMCGDYPAPCNCDDPDTHNGH